MLGSIHASHVETYTEGQEPIIYLIANVEAIAQAGLAFVFTDRNACTALAQFYNDMKDLGRLDWASLKSSDFRRSPDDPERMSRQQAEFLVKAFVPLGLIDGIAVFSERWKTDCETVLRNAGLTVPVKTKPTWYF